MSSVTRPLKRLNRAQNYTFVIFADPHTLSIDPLQVHGPQALLCDVIYGGPLNVSFSL